MRPLPPVAAQVDAALTRMDAEIDWLVALSPLHNEALWRSFQDSGRSRIPPLEYLDLGIDLRAAREALLALPMDRIESPLLEGLLLEKQRELDRQIELVRMRGTDGFINASIDLFGGVEARLLGTARQILDDVQPGPPRECDAGLEEVLDAVREEMAWYHEQTPDFGAQVVVDEDLASLMMVSHGTFYIAGDIRVPAARVQPLVQHEIGTHVVTRHNGRRQSLKQLEVGLAHYDALQEGLGVLSEYLAGYLPAERLRVLAARVVAADMAIHRKDVPEIFHVLHEEHGIPTEDAFDVAVRARRGGGLTKDAVYLSGLRDLLEHLQTGAPFEPLFMGKFALSQLTVLEQLVDEGWVSEPELMPRYWSGSAARERLEQCRAIDLADLFHKEPTA